MSTMIDVPCGSAYFEGHFPGRLILPGVAQLALILEALAREAGRPVSIQGIAFARLRRLVVPGDRLELEAREREASRLRIDLKREGILVANGEFILGSPLASPIATGPYTGPGIPVTTTPLDELLPHRPPMRFLKSILQQTADSLVCTAHIPGKCALVSSGSAPAVVSIEAAAQAAAAWEVLQRGRDVAVGSPRIGYLVALRDIAFFTDRLPADRDLLVSVTLEAAAPPLTHYRIEIALEGRLVTRGTIATFLAEDRA